MSLVFESRYKLRTKSYILRCKAGLLKSTKVLKSIFTLLHSTIIKSIFTLLHCTKSHIYFTTLYYIAYRLYYTVPQSPIPRCKVGLLEKKKKDTQIHE